jgi:hypothetical protein
MLNDLKPHCSPEQILARKPIVEREIVFGSCRCFRRMRDPTTTTVRPRSNPTASRQLARVLKLNRKVKRGLKFRSRSKQQKLKPSTRLFLIDHVFDDEARELGHQRPQPSIFLKQHDHVSIQIVVKTVVIALKLSLGKRIIIAPERRIHIRHD